jgi:hypothetical protein
MTSAAQRRLRSLACVSSALSRRFERPKLRTHAWEAHPFRAGRHQPRGLRPPPPVGSEPPTAVSGLADAILEAFKSHRLVGLGEIHGLQTHGDALTLLLSDPRLPEVVDDIAVQFGNALPTHNRPVAPASPSPSLTLDQSIGTSPSSTRICLLAGSAQLEARIVR